MRIRKVKAVWEINDLNELVRYFKSEDGDIYFPNPDDKRPSRQYSTYGWKGEVETNQLTLFEIKEEKK